MKNKTLFFITSIITIIICCGYNRCSRTVESIIKTDTVVVVKDTVYDTAKIVSTDIKYITETVLKTDTFISKEKDTVFLEETQRVFADTIVNSTDSVLLSITASGINPVIDTISAEWRKATIFETATVTNTIVKKKHFYFGVSAGAGYGFTSKKFDVWIGPTVTYVF